MSHTRRLDQVEADLVALRAAAERAGTSLACLFSSSDEFEAAVIKARREAGAYRRRRTGHPVLAIAATALLAIAFLML
jgi:hypothetical protein